MSECKIDFQNTFYIECINVIINSIGPSIILKSILCQLELLKTIWPHFI